MRRVLAVLSVLLGTLTIGLVTVPASVAGATTPSTTLYDSTNPAAAQLPSLAYEATQATEIGNQVVFASGTNRTLNNVVVSMDSWGCGTSGGWSTGDCVTAPNQTFAQPITFNLYAVNPDNTPGALIKSVTQTVNLSYRPSADNVNCTGTDAGKWFDAADSTCYNGMVTNATLNLGDVTVPNKVIYGIEIRTSDYGDPAIGGPLGDATACHATSQGCPYDSLNVALSLDPDNVTVGSNALTNGIYWNTGYAPNYCDGGTGGTGTFRFDSGCWGDASPYTSSPYDVPAVQFNSAPTCTTTCYVSTTGNDTNSGQADSPFATIQHAVNAVASGGTVHVAAGTYHEAVTISQPVTLDGANAGVPGTATRGAESVLSQTSGTSTLFNITTSSPVSINGFTTTFTGTDQPGQVTVGGLLLDTQANNTLTFTDNIVANSTFNNALFYDTSSVSSTLTNNLFTGTGQIGAGATGIVADWGSGSAQVNLTITGNTFSGLTETTNDGTPVLNINDAGGSISSNTFTNLHQYGILIADELSGLNILGNTFSGVYNSTPNTSSNRGSGVRTFLNPDFAGPVNVAGNTFTNMYHAVDVANDGTPADLTSGNFKVNRNIFVGPFTGAGTGVASTNSTAVNVASGTVGTLDATCNWWGSVAGATPNQYSGSVNASTNLFAPSPLASCGVPVAPAITSANMVQFQKGVAGSFTVTATGTPAPTLSVTGTLPAGIAFNPATGVLSGTPTTAANTSLTFVAHNGVAADASQAFTLVVSSNTAVITSASSLQAAAGKPVKFTVTTSGAVVATITSPDLPSWLTLKQNKGALANTAKLSGKAPAGGGDVTFHIHANNGIGPDTVQTFTVHVLTITSAAAANFSKSGPPTQSFTVTTSGAPLGSSIGISLNPALPAGLSFVDNGNGTATITGQPASTDRTKWIQIRVSTGAVFVTQRLYLGISI